MSKENMLSKTTALDLDTRFQVVMNWMHSIGLHGNAALSMISKEVILGTECDNGGRGFACAPLYMFLARDWPARR